jgi:hypothetical protein
VGEATEAASKTFYTVPKAFLIHEHFPVIAGKIYSSKWKIKIVKNFQSLLEHFPEITGNFSLS